MYKQSLNSYNIEINYTCNNSKVVDFTSTQHAITYNNTVANYNFLCLAYLYELTKKLVVILCLNIIHLFVDMVYINKYNYIWYIS